MPPNEKLKLLFDNMQLAFTIADLEGLAFEMDIDFQNIPGNIKDEKIRGFIAYCRNKTRLPELVALCKRERPRRNWPEL